MLKIILQEQCLWQCLTFVPIKNNGVSKGWFSLHTDITVYTFDSHGNA